MKLVKSLLLGSAAGLAAVAGAQAADLPVKKAAPVEYVRICSAYGAGFFFIPGTETCLRVSGRVRAEALYVEPEFRGESATGFRARARLNFDARTQTAYGTLRTFIRYESTLSTGSYGTQPGGFGSVNNFDLNKAFIQFGPITAGRATSFFDFYANDLNWGPAGRQNAASFTGSDTYANDPVVFAYTATLGQGFSATLSVEDPNARRSGFQAPINPLTGPVGGGVITYAGQRMPEIVGNVRVDQAWGSAQVAGAVHQIFAANRVTVGADTGAFVDTEYGFAVSGGVKINMPFIAPGDVLWLQATYQQGATNYQGLGSANGASLQTGAVNVSTADALVDVFGNVKKTEGFVLLGAFLHYWTPQIRQAVFGSYGQIDVPASLAAAVDPVTGARVSGAFVDTDYFMVGSNLIWSPVRDLDIGVEVLYRNVDPRGRLIDRTFPGGVGIAGSRTVSSDDALEARFRIQRDF